MLLSWFSAYLERHNCNPNGPYNVNGLKIDSNNSINGFSDHENIDIDPLTTLVCALVLVLCLFPCFRVMADEKCPLVVEFGTKWIFKIFM